MIHAIGSFHFWTSVFIGIITSISIHFLVIIITKYWFILNWQQSVRWYLFKKEGFGFHQKYYTDEIPIYLEIEKEDVVNFTTPLSFISVSLGLLVLTKLLLSSKTFTPKNYRQRKRWEIVIHDNHFWNSLHVVIKSVFVIAIFSALGPLIHHKTLLLMGILFFVYSYLLSLTSLRKFFKLKNFPVYLLFSSIFLCLLFQFIYIPNTDNLKKDFEQYKEEQIEWRKSEQLIETEIPDPPPSPLKD